MSYILNRIKSLFIIDKIRGLKILELWQYCIVFFLVTLIISKALNKYIFTDEIDKIHNMSLIQLILSIIFDLCIIVLAFFYIRKISLLVPSLATYISSDFKGHTTLEYTIHVALIFVFLELVSGLKDKIESLKEKMK